MALRFLCNYCPAEFPNFKGLVEHYEANHADKLKRYDIRNRSLKQSGLVYATSAQEACESLGWMIGDCLVKEMK